MSSPIVIPIRRLSRPGAGDLWTLELLPTQASLRDHTGELRNAFTPAEAASVWGLPDFISKASLTLPTDEGPADFRCTRQGRRHIGRYTRAGLLEIVKPEDILAQRRRAFASIGVGIVLTLLGIAATTYNLTRPPGDSGVPYSFGFAILGAVAIITGVQRLNTCRFLRGELQRQAARPPHAAPVAPSTPIVLRPPRRSAGVMFLAAVILLLSIVIAVGFFITNDWLLPKKRPQPAPPPPQVAPTPAVVAQPDPVPSPIPEQALIPSEELPQPAPIEPPATTASTLVLAGAIEQVDAPQSLRVGSLVSARKIRLIIEAQDHELTTPLECDAVEPALIRAGSPGTPGTIAAGTKIRSYLLHADAPDSKSALIEGRITFPAPILGVITDSRTLDPSDRLGRKGVAYPSAGKWRGWFDGSDDDWISISADRRTLSVRCDTAKWIDQVRIVTESP